MWLTRQGFKAYLNIIVNTERSRRVKEKLKEYEVHFYPQKNDMLDTEFNFAFFME